MKLAKRPFGNTGIEVSELVFGGGAVGGILIDADDETKRQVIHKAIDGQDESQFVDYWINLIALAMNGGLATPSTLPLKR